MNRTGVGSRNGRDRPRLWRLIRRRFPSPARAGRLFDQLGYDVVEMVLADPQGWDRYEAAKWMTMRRWLEENPDDEFAQEVRTELTVAPKRHVTGRENTLAGAYLR